MELSEFDRGIVDTQMEGVFSSEWIRADSEGRRLVMADYCLAVTDDHVSAREYQRRIGTGNLQAYIDCLKVGESRKNG